MSSIKVCNAALDVIVIDGVEMLAIRGVIDPGSLEQIQVPDYQREVLSRQKVDALKAALLSGRVPDIDLGMRGTSYLERNDAFYLQDPTFVVDGLQRTTAAQELAREGHHPSLGALIHIETNEQWERERFEALNVGQTGLSNNVTLRNMAKTYESAAIMLRLCSDKGFVLCRKVAWTQNMRRGDLTTAITYYKVVGRLHSHAGPTKGSVRDMPRGLDKVIANIGKNIFMANVRAFYQLIDDAWGISNVAYRNQAIQLKTAFQLALAAVVSDHESFWDGDRLVVPTHITKKLAQFPITDPSVVTLAGSAGQAGVLLQQLMINHIDSGRRTRRLVKRSGIEPADVSDEVEDELVS